MYSAEQLLIWLAALGMLITAACEWVRLESENRRLRAANLDLNRTVDRLRTQLASKGQPSAVEAIEGD